MPIDRHLVHIEIAAANATGLLAHLCGELGRVLASDRRWEPGDAMVPWHTTAGSVLDLPARVIDAVLAEWDAAGASLAGVEFSGFLETDQGPRAWGCLVVRDGETPSPPEVAQCAVEHTEAGYRLVVELRRTDGVSDA